jgi:chlorobactene glucosyltransferase
MDWTSLILLAGWGVICNVWAVLLYAQRVAMRQGIMLKPTEHTGHDDTDQDTPATESSVCIVIPARNEAESIGGSLAAALAQQYPRLRVVVVDDRSEDATAAVADAIAQKDDRLSVMKIDRLPKGWLGKSHALWTATRGVTDDWLLFVDADCTLRPGAVRAALDEAVRRDVSMLSLWPGHLAQSFWEHMLIPLCAAVMALWFGRANRSRPGSGTAFANGQFILIRRVAYEKIGGHRAVRRAIIEDVPLAELASRMGVRCWTAGGRDLVGVRMYKDLVGVCDGWTRIFVGALRSKTKLALSIGWLWVGSLMPFLLGPYLVYQLMQPGPADPMLLAFAGTCLAHLVLMYAVSWRFWKFGYCDRRYLVLYPVSVIVVSALLARAFWWMLIRRIVGWRKTYYTLDSRAMIVD